MSERRAASARSRRGFGARLGRVLLTVGAVLGTATMVIAAIVAIGGFRPLVFQSASMAPAIDAGALAFAKTIPADEARVGDVVSVVNQEGVRVSHRVVTIGEGDEGTTLQLQGDANAHPDAEIYQVDEVDRIVLDVPYVGHVLNWARQPWALVVSGALIVLLLYVAFAPRGGGPSAGGRRRATGAAVLVTVAGLAVGTVPGVTHTQASFSDVGTMTGGAMSAHTMASQAQPACTNVDGILILGNIARLTWPQVHARYEYYWELRNANNNNLAASGTVGSGIAAGQTVTLDIATGLIGTNTNYNVIIRARLVSPNAWQAATTTTTPVRRATILIIGAAFRCGHA